MQVLIGTSGYSYSEWVGDFYPEGTSAAKMLPYYCTQFPVAEINFTYYRPPTRRMLLNIAAKTPAGYPLYVKVPGAITHRGSDLDVPGFRDAAEGLKASGHLGGVLAQFPQAMHCTRSACDRVKALAKEFAGLNLAVEFRHRSWARPGLPAWLAELGADLVAVDVPEIPALFPSGWVQSSRTAYVRLHSRNAAKWYEEGGVRYDYDYSDDDLGQWIDEMSVRASDGSTARTLLLFNNCQRSQAAVNARRMGELIRQRVPGVEVVAPPCEEGARQMTLFAGVG